MNICPVYRSSGGHSYHNATSGPIGSILAPNLDMKKYVDLPFACTLRGSSTHVCPVKIDIHDQLYKWRQVIVKEGYADATKTVGMRLMNLVLSSPKMYRLAGKIGRWFIRYIPSAVNTKYNLWFKHREMPEPTKQPFRD